MHNQRTSWRYDVSFTEKEKMRLWAFMKEELDFYNNINERMISQLRQGNYKSFKNLSKKLHVLGEICEANLDIKNIIKNKEIPESLKSVENDLVFLTEEEMRVLEIPAIKTYLSPRTKRNMTIQMFKYYCHQASAYTDSGEYKFAPLFLESVDFHKKRHLQLHRKAVKVDKYIDSDTGKTVSIIKNPYIDSGIKVNGDINKLKWNLMIIHQTPGVRAVPNSPWVIDLKKVSEDYILQYLDYNYNPEATFNQYKNSYKRTYF